MLAHASGGRLILVQVVEPWKLSPDERSDTPRRVHDRLRRIAQELHGSGLDLRNLIVAVDGRPGGARALDQGARLARSTGAALVLVRVIQPHGTFGFDHLLRATLGVQPLSFSDAEALEAPEEYVNDVSRRLREHGIEATPRVMVGQPAERIAAAAEQVDAAGERAEVLGVPERDEMPLRAQPPA